MSTPATSNPENSTEIPGLLVPMATGKLILPAVAVAEMIPWQAPTVPEPFAGEEVPEWYLGSLSWRGVTIPMVSFERLNGDPVAPVTPKSHLIILNNTGANPRVSFFSMPTVGIPGLSRVMPDDIAENPDTPLKDYEQMHVVIGDEPAILPDNGKIEQACGALPDYRA